jgi:O-antigen/teichoic acid export membrane protein
MAGRWYSLIIRENMYGVAAQVLTILSGAVSTILFPRILGSTMFGYFSLVFSLANLSLFFCDFGTMPALQKLIPSSMVRGETGAYYRFLSRLKYVLVILSSVLLFLFSDVIAERLFHQPELGFGIRISVLFVFSFSLFSFYDTIFAVAKRNKFSFYVNAVFQMARIILPVGLYYLHRTYTSFLLGLGLAALVSVISEMPLKRRLSFIREGKGRIDYATFKTYFFYGALAYLGVVLLQWMDSIIVGVFISPAEVGFYRVGVMWMGVVWLFIPLSSRVLLSLYSEKTETKEMETVNRVYTYSLRYSLLITFLIMVGVWLTSDYFISFIYGPSYAAAAPVLLILSFLALESALYAINTPLLQGVGRIDVYTKYTLIVGVLSVAGAIYGARFGIAGVAFAVTIIRTIGILLLTAYVIAHLKMRLKPATYIKPMACAIATFLLLLPLRAFVTSLPSAIAYCIAIVIFYSAATIAVKALTLEEVGKIAGALREH